MSRRVFDRYYGLHSAGLVDEEFEQDGESARALVAAVSLRGFWIDTLRGDAEPDPLNEIAQVILVKTRQFPPSRGSGNFDRFRKS